MFGRGRHDWMQLSCTCDPLHGALTTDDAKRAFGRALVNTQSNHTVRIVLHHAAGGCTQA